MTQKLYVLLPFFFASFCLSADPLEDLTYEEAQQLISHLQLDPYIIDYCDCCSDGPDYIIRVSDLSIEAAEYGARPYRVRAKGTYIYELQRSENGYFSIKDSKKGGFEDIIWTNYSFAFDPEDKMAHPIGQVLGIRESGNCNPDAHFPAPDQLRLQQSDPGYHQWYQSRIGYPGSEMDVASLSAHPDATGLMANMLPDGIIYQGDFVAAETWGTGHKHFMIASEIIDRESNYNALYVCQWTHNGMSISLDWAIRDYSPAGGKVYFENNGLQLIDLDGDLKPETSFIYTIRDPQKEHDQVKLMLHHNGTKLAIRGSTAKGDKLFDPAFDRETPAFKNYASMVWDRYMEEGESAYLDQIIHRRDNLIVLRQEYLFASGGFEYQLLQADFNPIIDDGELNERIRFAEDISAYPNGKGLVILARPNIDYFMYDNMEYGSLMQVFPDSRGISSVSWSPDGRKAAFVVLNNAQYPKDTRLFILELDGKEVVSKQKFDIPNYYFAASMMVVAPVQFIDNNTISYQVQDPERRKEEMREIKID
ncbi:MAG: hypothetical protein GYB31_02720 [Bacteroidetes bacterium]|nr:hypothetical protein [Bacteroidota bacterium]